MSTKTNKTTSKVKKESAALADKKSVPHAKSPLSSHVRTAESLKRSMAKRREE